MSRSLRLRTVALTALTCLFLLATVAGPAAATPPSAVDLSFDKTAGVLTVSITHDSENTATHYIYKVEIKKNGAAYNTSLYTSQPDAHRFTYTYNVVAGDGDKIEVTASCVLFGFLTTKLDVATGKTVSSGGSAYSLWPYHAALMATGVALSVVSISSVYMKKKPWWFRGHNIMGALGGGFLVAGMLLAAYFISASGGTQFRVPHAWVGLAAILLVLALLAVGLVYIYKVKLKRTVRAPHIWIGRAAIILLPLNIVLGLVLVGLLKLG
jgi:hypothetical protein